MNVVMQSLYDRVYLFIVVLLTKSALAVDMFKSAKATCYRQIIVASKASLVEVARYPHRSTHVPAGNAIAWSNPHRAEERALIIGGQSFDLGLCSMASTNQEEFPRVFPICDPLLA